MWPDKLTDFLVATRKGILAFNPLNEIEKRATKYGEDVGLGLERSRAQAGYARTHPESQRAQTEQMMNALAMITWKPIKGVSAEHLAKINKKLPETIIAPAMGNKKAKLYNTSTTHADALPNLLRYLAEKGKEASYDVHGWLTSRGRVVSDEVAYKIKEKELSAPVRAQAATRAQQRGGAAKLTSEDVKGKLTPNRGTRAAEPMTDKDMDRIVAAKKAGELPDIGEDALEALTQRGGFSIDPKTGYPVSEGFAVGAGKEPGHNLLKLPLKGLTPAQIQTWFAENVGKFAKGSVVGGWVDDGVAYIEPSTLVRSEKAAHALGAKRGEKEIYDFKTKTSVPVRSPASGNPGNADRRHAPLDSIPNLSGARLPSEARRRNPVAGSIRPGKHGPITSADDQLWDKYQASLTDPNWKPSTPGLHEAVNASGRVVGSIRPPSASKQEVQEAVKRGTPIDWNRIAPPKPEVIGVEAPAMSGNLAPNKEGVAGYIVPVNPMAAQKLSIRNQVSPDVEAANPSVPGLRLLETLSDKMKRKPKRGGKPDPNEPTMLYEPENPAYERGHKRPPSPEEQHRAEFRAIDSTWNVSMKALNAIGKNLTDEPTTRRMALADAARGGPKPPRGDALLMGAYNVPGYIPTVNAIKYAKQLPQQFEHFINKTKVYDEMDPPRSVSMKAIDIEEAARNVIRQAQHGVFVPPHATRAEAAEIIELGQKLVEGWGNLDLNLSGALQKVLNAARFLQAKKD